MSLGAPHAPCWLVRRHFTSPFGSVGVLLSPGYSPAERGAGTPEIGRGIEENNEGRSRQRARTGGRNSADRKWRGPVVRWNRPGGHCRESCRQLRHGIPRGLDQQDICRAGTAEIARRRKGQPLRPVAGCRTGNPVQESLGGSSSRPHRQPPRAHCRLRRHGAKRSLQRT